VAFLLIVAVNRVLRARGRFASGGEPDLMRWLDLVALGAACDMVPLVGLNRAFVTQGLKILARRGNPGLAALIDVARIEETPGAFHAGFLLGPRINAGGRVGESDLGHRLLVSQSVAAAIPIAERLDRLNEERKAIEARMLDEALNSVEREEPTGRAVMVVSGEEWHPGVIGLIASRLVERYGRPTFALAWDGGVGKGSARSVAGFDIGAAITAARQAGLVMVGGGHAMAAGLTLARDKLGAFTDFIENRLQQAEVSTRPSLDVDASMSTGGATPELYQLLDRAGPYGSGNPEPRFALSACRVEYAKVVGADHVSCRLAGEGKKRLKAIAFRSADRDVGQAILETAGRPLHCAGHLRADRWNGRDDVQLIIEDVARVA
jgi:single-stranded-DNA-specific exonuclease